MPIAIMYSVLNVIEIRDPVTASLVQPITKFTAAKINFAVIYLFAIVSAYAVTWKEEVLLQKIF